MISKDPKWRTIKVDDRWRKGNRTYLSAFIPGKVPFQKGQLVGFILNNERMEYKVLGWSRLNKLFEGFDGKPLRGDNVVIWVEE